MSIDPYLRSCLATLSVSTAAIHFAVMPDHFAEYWLFGAFFLVSALAQLAWAGAVMWRLRPWLWWVA